MSHGQWTVDGQPASWVPGLLVPSTVGRVRLAPLIPLIARPGWPYRGCSYVGCKYTKLLAHDGLASFAFPFISALSHVHGVDFPIIWKRGMTKSRSASRREDKLHRPKSINGPICGLHD